MTAQYTAADDEEIMDFFVEASGGRQTVTFDQAMRLEVIDDILEEDATTVEELLYLWGDRSTSLSFEEFKSWYQEVERVFEDFTWEEAVAPPAELLEDVQEELDQEELDDDELLEDAPATGQSVAELTARTAQEAAMAASGGVELADDTPAPVVTVDGPGRDNVEITRLFREACDDENRLSLDGLLQISEINDMLENDEVTKEELEGMFNALPVQAGTINVLAFRDLLKRIDDLFEYEDEKEEEKGNQDGEGTETAGEGTAIVAPKQRDTAVVKSELLRTVASLQAQEGRPCGLGGAEETDGGVTKLTQEMEELFRSRLGGDLAEFDESGLLGDWELVYSTSVKYRRWECVLRGTKYLNGAQVDTLVQNFSVEPGTGAREYDMEEVYLKEDKELCGRALGSWVVNLTDNVVSGDDDLLLKLNLTESEFDTEEGEIQPGIDKVLTSPIARAFCYSFISYIDDETLIMRTGLGHNSVFIYQRMKEEEEEEEKKEEEKAEA